MNRFKNALTITFREVVAWTLFVYGVGWLFAYLAFHP